nr:uncharacterized protein LOC114921535 isoform X3 [Labrus bergylta]
MRDKGNSVSPNEAMMSFKHKDVVRAERPPDSGVSLCARVCRPILSHLTPSRAESTQLVQRGLCSSMNRPSCLQRSHLVPAERCISSGLSTNPPPPPPPPPPSHPSSSSSYYYYFLFAST